MSLEIVRHVNTQHPELLRSNVVMTCDAFAGYVVTALNAAGHEAYRMAKTSGEGQFTPPGFVPHTVTGLDGKPYVCTGRSHDAIWCDGQQFDTIAQGNDSDRAIYKKSTEPFWSFDPNDGPQIQGIPVWNAIPQANWRPNNPPLKDQAPPPPPPAPTFPSYEAAGGDSFYRAVVGVPLAADYLLAGQAMNDGSAVWFSRTIYDVLAALVKANGQPVDMNAIAKRHRNEWRVILGLPPL